MTPPIPNAGSAVPLSQAPQPRARRLWDRLTLRFVRPLGLRLAVLAALVLVSAGGVASVGTRVWFAHHLRAARQAAERWHNAAAGRHLSYAMAVRPDHPEVLVLRSRLARRTGDQDGAEGYLDRFAEVHGEGDDAAVFERLLIRAGQGDLEGTAAALQSRTAAGGESARLVREAAVTGLLTLHRYADAVAVLDAWQADTPDDPLALLLRGKYLETRLGLEAAAGVYRRAIDLDPELLDARLRLANLLVGRRLGEEAVTQTQALRDRLPDNPQVRVLHARALALVGRPADARAELDGCLRRFPDHPDALSERGTQLLVAGDEPAAVADLGRAVALDPGHVAARNQYALALARAGRPDDSRREYATVAQLQEDGDRMQQLIGGPLQRNPHDPGLLHELGAICARAGLPRDAVRWFGRALEADPNHLPTHRALVVLYRQLDKPILAARHRAAVQQLTPQPRP